MFSTPPWTGVPAELFELLLPLPHAVAANRVAAQAAASAAPLRVVSCIGSSSTAVSRLTRHTVPPPWRALNGSADSVTRPSGEGVPRDAGVTICHATARCPHPPRRHT